MIRARKQRELAEAISGAKVVEVDCAHNGWLVRPEAVTAAVGQALDIVTVGADQPPTVS